MNLKHSVISTLNMTSQVKSWLKSGMFLFGGQICWYNGDNVVLNGSTISQFTDLSGKGNHAIQTNAALQPTYTAAGLNGYPVATFNTAEWMECATFDQTYNQPNTLFSVWKINSNAAGCCLCDGTDRNTNRHAIFWNSNLLYANSAYSGSISYSRVATAAGFDYILTTCEYNGASSELFEDGVSKITGNPGTLPISGIILGRFVNNAYHLNGEIAEYMLYEGIVEETKKVAIEDYLLKKYALV